MATVCLLVLSTLLPVGAARVGSTLAPAGRVLPASSRTPTFLFPATTRQHEHRRQQRNVPHTATTPRARPGARRDRAGLSSGVGSESELVGAAGSGVEDRTWKWRGYDIRYKVAGEGSDGPPMVLIHGFGGNADHWRKNLPTLAKTGPAYAIDLLGYGFSSKPDPGSWDERNNIYCFETWSQQVRDFANEVIGKPVFLVCNSVGGVAGLQAGVDAPKEVLGVVLFNISLRMLHTTKQPLAARPLVLGLQYVLRETPLGALFFGSVAKPKAVSNILKQCYGDPEQVTPELVECILTPGLETGAVKVFLDFISYSGGPLPEDLLGVIKVPVVIAWGVEDPWEPIEQGRAYADFDSVEGFIDLPGAGHCPQDEAPHLTDPVVLDFVNKHYKTTA